jgi:hypothetical protein
MSLPSQPEEYLDHVRTVGHDEVPTVQQEVDEILSLSVLREVSSVFKSLAMSRSCLSALKLY